ncbi:MAG: class II aldolase/adducin family protein, partial [Promethearchaeota archaeon]
MTIDGSIYKTFWRVGKDLSNRGLNTSHSGNISIRNAGKMIIKKRAAMLGWLEPEDLVETSLEDEDSFTLIASTEAQVHRMIYQQTDAMAIIHAHCPYSVTMSLIDDSIECIDAEGSFMYKKIPVVQLEVPAGASEAAIKVPPMLKNYKAVIVRTHGVFAKGATLEDALCTVTGVEQSAMIRYLALQTGKELKQDLSKSKNL